MANPITRRVTTTALIQAFLLLICGDFTSVPSVVADFLELSPKSLKWASTQDHWQENSILEKDLPGENDMYSKGLWNADVPMQKQYQRDSNRHSNEAHFSGEQSPKRYRASRFKSNRPGSVPSQMGRPILRPARNFDPREDAERLRTVLNKKILVDDDIIDILTKRTDDQRKKIFAVYPKLKNDLSLKLSFGFRELMKALATPLHEFHAEQVKEALEYSNEVDESRLVELLCTLNNRQLKSVQQAYRDLYRKDISEDLRSYDQNPFINFLIFYSQGYRDERHSVDRAQATFEAQQLHNSGRLSIAEGSRLRKILLSKSFPQLKLIFNEYRRYSGRSITDAIRKELTGNVQKGLLNIVKTISNRPQYFAEILNSGIRNFNQRDATLIRVILLRSEIDMADIKRAYEDMYNIPLATSIPTNTGSLKKALISLISG